MFPIVTIARSCGLLLGSCWFFGCFMGQDGEPLAKLPAVQLQALLSTTNPNGGTIVLNVLPQDLTQCPKLADSIQADVNGSSLLLSYAGGWQTRKGGGKYCEPAHFDGSGIALTGDTTIHVHDSTAMFQVDAPGALRSVSTALTQPADGVLRAGAAAEIRLTPNVGAITHAFVGFLPADAGTASFSVEFPGSTSLSVSDNALSFSVPATTPTATGALQLSFSIDVPVTLCQGPATCTAQTGGGSTISASVAAP